MKKASDGYAIITENLAKSFKHEGSGKEVLKGISLKVPKNQIFGILGPNGAGKTTLINILCGILHAESGTASVLGLDPKSQRRELAKRINICSGNSMFIYLLTPREILKYYGLLYGMKEKDIEANSLRLINDLGITSFADVQFGELSTGMKQKVALAKSLINDPELLFLDEPTLGLDVEVARNIRQYIGKLVDEKKMTIILTSHYLFEVEELCGNIAIIHNGRILAEGTVEKIKESANVELIVVASTKVPSGDIRFIEKLDCVRKVRVKGNEIIIHVDGGPLFVEKVISAFRSKGVALSNIEVRRATLEEAFLRLVNRRK